MPTEPSPSAVTAAAWRRTVLIVDGEASMRRFVAQQLQSAGFHCITEAYSDALLRRLAKNEFTPDLVVLADSAPLRRQVQLVRQICARHPCIILTYDQPEVCRELYGADAVLQRPIRLTRFYEVLRPHMAAMEDFLCLTY